jgi:hypothetical protein
VVSIWDWLAFVIFFALAVAATYRLPRYWRGETLVIPLMSRWWPFGGAFLRDGNAPCQRRSLPDGP